MSAYVTEVNYLPFTSKSFAWVIAALLSSYSKLISNKWLEKGWFEII
jgi:hypothetical protein